MNFEELNDEALIKIITSDINDYTEEALEKVKSELSKRDIDYIALMEEYEKETKDQIEYDAIIFFTTVSNSSEAVAVKSVLNSYDIPIYSRYWTRYGYGYQEDIVSYTDSELDLYAPSKFIERAKEIIESNRAEIQSQIEEPVDGPIEYEYVPELDESQAEDADMDGVNNIEDSSGQKIKRMNPIALTAIIIYALVLLAIIIKYLSDRAMQ